MPISRFSNPFRRSVKSDRIYDNELLDAKNGTHFYPDLIPEPNVGYVDSLNLLPLKESSDFARKQRSLGAWQKKDNRGIDYSFLQSPEIRYQDSGQLQQSRAGRNLARLRGLSNNHYENIGEFLNPIEAENEQKNTLRERLKTWQANRPQQDLRRDTFDALKNNAQNARAKEEALRHLSFSNSLRQRSNLNQAFSRMRGNMQEARGIEAQEQARLLRVASGASKLETLADRLNKQKAFNSLYNMENSTNKYKSSDKEEAERIAMLPQLLQSKYKMGIANYIANHIRNPEDPRGLSYPSVNAIKMQELQNHILDEVNKQIPDNATDYLTNEYYNTIGANIYAQRTPNYQAMLKSQPSFQKAYDLKSLIDSIKNKILANVQNFR